MSVNWSSDMSTAPRGAFIEQVSTVKGKQVKKKVFQPDKIWVAGSNGHVTTSHWKPKEQRWLMFTKDIPPTAWRPYDFEEFLTFDEEGKLVRGRPEHPEQSS